MESRFERITESPDALAAVLASIPTADAPWDIAFERAFCAGCALENCDGCPHKNLDRIKWWLEQQTAKAFLTRKGERSGWFSMSKKQELVDKLVLLSTRRKNCLRSYAATTADTPAPPTERPGMNCWIFARTARCPDWEI